jgi:DtxR family Mn-dependent transcriptional regulator
MGYSWDKVDAEAERLEHVISEEFEDKIDEMLGYPKTDPHGSPIPTKEGIIDKHSYDRLIDIAPGKNAMVRRIPNSDPELLRYLGNLGLKPETEVAVLKKEPFDGPLLLRIGEEEHHIGHQVACGILVTSE